MKLGARILRTGITIIFALFIASFLPDNVSLKSVAGISAIFAMQPNVYRPMKTISEQVTGNLTGAILAVIMVTIFGKNIVIMDTIAILLIAILYKLNLAHVATLTDVTALIIMGQHTESFYLIATFRFILVMIGVLSTSLVDLVFLPPRFETKIYHNAVNISSDIFIWFKFVINDTSEYHQVKEDGEQLESHIVKLEQIYDYYHEERTFARKAAFQQSHKKILFKEVAGTTRQAYKVLNCMARYQSDLYNTNHHLLFQIKLELDSLTAYHEQILKSLSKKAHYSVDNFDNQILNPQKKNLVDAFQYQLVQNPYQVEYSYSNIMQITAAIEEYRYHLEHLDRLRLSFFTYHRNDADVEIQDEDSDL